MSAIVINIKYDNSHRQKYETTTKSLKGVLYHFDEHIAMAHQRPTVAPKPLVIKQLAQLISEIRVSDMAGVHGDAGGSRSGTRNVERVSPL